MNNSLLSRRTFLGGSAAAGLTLGLTRRAVGQASEINMVGWNSPALKAVFARSASETGIKINYDVLPSKWDDVMQKITLWGQTGYSGIDVLFADDLIGGLWGMNGWAEDLSGTAAWTKNSGNVVDNITVLNKAVGGVYRLFFTLGLEPFFYNKTMIANAPATWGELTSAAQAATKASDGIWGWRPLGGEGHAFNTVLLMLNQAGADLGSLADPATLQALQFMYDWVHTSKITPPSTVSEDNAAVIALAAAGKAAMWWTYDSGLRTIVSVDKTKVPLESIGLARWPKGPVSDVGLVHGWGWLVPKASKKKDVSSELLNWLTSPAIIKEISVAQGVAPPYHTLFTDADVRARLPQLSVGPGWAELLRGARFRQPIVSSPQVTQLWSMFDNLGSYVLSGERTPADAQAWAVDEYKTIKGA